MNLFAAIVNKHIKLFLLRSSDCMLETCLLLAGVRVHEHWSPVKAIRVGAGRVTFKRLL